MTARDSNNLNSPVALQQASRWLECWSAFKLGALVCCLGLFVSSSVIAQPELPTPPGYQAPSQGSSSRPADSNPTPTGASPALVAPRAPSPPATGQPRASQPNASSTGETRPNVALAVALNQRGDLTLRNNTSLNEALLTISELWRINIVAGDVPGTVYGVFKDAPLREILDSILISNGYGYRTVGESLVVSRLEKLGQVNPFFESATIPILAADVEEVVAGAKLLSTPSGEIRAIASARSLFVLDFPDRVKMIRDFVASVDDAARLAAGGAPIGAGPAQLKVAYLKTHYVAALDAVPVLQTVLSPSGRIAAMEKEDRLMLVDLPENLKMAGIVLERIDRPRPQVGIRALIYDISLQDMEELGVNWQSLSGGGTFGTTVSGGGALNSSATVPTGTGTLFNSVTKAPFTDGSTGGAFTFFTLNNNFNLAAVALALQQANDSRLLASPNVTVVDNEEATIESVSEIPFQQLTQTAAGGNIGTTAFRDAGIRLVVKPKISMDGTIEMNVKPEFSRLTGFTPGDNQPIIDRRVATTSVRIANGQTFVIAGLRQRADVGDFKGIPLLKDVRFFGKIFRARETDIRESELVVFINPTIVGYDEPLSPRNQCVADTVNCRLAQIPKPEGCPGGCCGAGGSSGCGPGCAGGCVSTANPNAKASNDAELNLSPVSMPADGVATRNAARSTLDNSILPIPANEEVADQLQQPRIGSRPRRLPPIDMAAADDGQRVASRMRPDYDSRYRATGGVYERQPEPQAADSKAKPRKSFWNRVLKR